MTRRVLFHRNYKRFYGGHLKVLDYFRHTEASGGHQAEIYLTPGSVPDHPWADSAAVVEEYRPEMADILFVASMDWTALDGFPGIEDRIPVINLIQHLRHAVPGHPLSRFLNRRATRICVSAEVSATILATGLCNGPVHTIPNGLDLAALPAPAARPDHDVFIAGLKQPELAADLSGRLADRGLSVDCAISHMDRAVFLDRMSRAGIAVLLPRAEEGFYLPALEAMAMGRVVICPDCGGNRAFCIDGVSALVPVPEAAALAAAVLRIMQSPALAAALRAGGQRISAAFGIMTERSAYHQVLNGIGS